MPALSGRGLDRITQFNGVVPNLGLRVIQYSRMASHPFDGCAIDERLYPLQSCWFQHEQKHLGLKFETPLGKHDIALCRSAADGQISSTNLPVVQCFANAVLDGFGSGYREARDLVFLVD